MMPADTRNRDLTGTCGGSAVGFGRDAARGAMSRSVLVWVPRSRGSRTSSPPTRIMLRIRATCGKNLASLPSWSVRRDHGWIYIFRSSIVSHIKHPEVFALWGGVRHDQGTISPLTTG